MDSKPIEDTKIFSDTTRGEVIETALAYPFHFHAEGQFTYYERDKLLRFITQNAVGLSSEELDLQIQSGKVFFSRISEYAGIRLIQELRDSPLRFQLYPSPREPDESRIQPRPEVGTFTETTPADADPSRNRIPVLTLDSPERVLYESLGPLLATQFLKIETVEVEKSGLYQEVLERLQESLRIKAQIKGADAILTPETKVESLRLPSQYQLTLTTTLLKKR